MVEQWDTEEVPAQGAGPVHVAPAHTRTWFHNGLAPRPAADSRRQEMPYALRAPVLPPGLDPDEEREAFRALHGMVLRREVRGLAWLGAGRAPLTPVEEQGLTVLMLQPRVGDAHAVFLGYPPRGA